MSKKKSDEKITQSIQEIMKQNPVPKLDTPQSPLEEPRQKLSESWGAKKTKK